MSSEEKPGAATGTLEALNSCSAVVEKSCGARQEQSLPRLHSKQEKFECPISNMRTGHSCHGQQKGRWKGLEQQQIALSHFQRSHSRTPDITVMAGTAQ